MTSRSCVLGRMRSLTPRCVVPCFAPKRRPRRWSDAPARRKAPGSTGWSSSRGSGQGIQNPVPPTTRPDCRALAYIRDAFMREHRSDYLSPCSAVHPRATVLRCFHGDRPVHRCLRDAGARHLRRFDHDAARRSAGSRSRAQSIMTTTPVGSPSASTVRSAALSTEGFEFNERNTDRWRSCH
jgi:hypothetical protein